MVAWRREASSACSCLSRYSCDQRSVVASAFACLVMADEVAGVVVVVVEVAVVVVDVGQACVARVVFAFVLVSMSFSSLKSVSM